MPPQSNSGCPEKPRILLIDDNCFLLDAGSHFLEHRENFLVETASSVKDAIECLRHTSYDAVVSDYEMPEMDGSEFRRRLRARGILIPFILFTAKPQAEIWSERSEDPGACVCKCGEPAEQYSRLADSVREEISRVQRESIIRDPGAAAGI